MPIDVMWSDLDYMFDRRAFTLNPESYYPQELIDMVNKTNPEAVEWVPIIDPGVAVPSECG